MSAKEILNKIQKIQIETSKLAHDLLAGMYRSAFKGQGIEFEELREYQPGEDIRAIDWKVTARMHHPYMKVFREERELTVMLVVDVSSSSRFGTSMTKREMMAELAAVLAFSAIENRDNVGLILFSSEVELYIPPKKGTRHVLRVIRELLTFEPQKQGTDLGAALQFLGNVQRHSCVCFLVSDFICDHVPDRLAVSSKHYDLIGISVTDPSELIFPSMDLVHVVDIESGESAEVDTSDPEVQQQFQRMARERQDSIQKIMQRVGAGFIELRTDEGYLAPLQKFFRLRRVKH